MVDEFVRRLDDPARWRHPLMINDVARLCAPDIGGGDLRDLLLAGPDRLTAAAAAHCLQFGVSCLLPQDCGLPPLLRHALPPECFRLVAYPAPLTD